VQELAYADSARQGDTSLSCSFDVVGNDAAPCGTAHPLTANPASWSTRAPHLVVYCAG